MRFSFLSWIFAAATFAAAPRSTFAAPRDDYEDDDEASNDDARNDDRRADRSDEDAANRPPAWTRDKRGRPKKYLPVRKGKAPPPGYEEGTRPIVGLIIPGAILLPVAWLTSSVSSLTCGLVQVAEPRTRGCQVDDVAWGVMPLVGPFVVATAPGTEPGWRAGYALYGAFQNAGLAMVIVGASIQRDVWVLTPEARALEGRASVFVGPTGMGVRGAF